MSQQSIPPGLMFRSFLTVASGYVLTYMCFVGIALGLGATVFPEFMEFFKLDIEAQEKVMANDPSAAIPKPMFWSMVVLNVIACSVIGWLVVKTAPFAHFAHAVFLAVLVFIFYLQTVIADPPAKKWMDIVYMGALPIAILYGANWAFTRLPYLGDESAADDPEPDAEQASEDQ